MYHKKKYLSEDLVMNNKNDIYTHENPVVLLRFLVFLLKNFILWEICVYIFE